MRAASDFRSLWAIGGHLVDDGGELAGADHEHRQVGGGRRRWRCGGRGRAAPARRRSRRGRGGDLAAVATDLGGAARGSRTPPARRCPARTGAPGGEVDLVGWPAPPPAAPSSSRPRRGRPKRGGRGATGEPWRRSIGTDGAVPGSRRACRNASQGRNNRETFAPYGRAPWMSSSCAGRSEQARRDELRSEGRPRLLLLEDGAAAARRPPTSWRTGSGCRPARSTCGPGSTGSPPRRGHASTRPRPSTTTACCASATAGCRCRRSRPASRPPCSTATAPSCRATRWPGPAGRPGAPGPQRPRRPHAPAPPPARRRSALAIRTVRSRGYLLERLAADGGQAHAQ